MRIALFVICMFAAGARLAAQSHTPERNEMTSRTHALEFNAPPGKVFNFLSIVENLPKWAVEFCQRVEQRGGQWWVTTPKGELMFRIDAEPKTGALNMFAGPTPDQMQVFPTRVFALPGGRSLYLFTSIQYPGVSDEEFESQCALLVEHEFPALKRQVEGPKAIPAAIAFTSSPRNRVRIELKAPAPEVWALVGDLARFPEYSSGLERVDAKRDSSGRCTEYMCHFKPLEEGGESIVSRELIRWYEPNRGYASSGDGSAFGQARSGDAVVLPAR